MQASEQILNCKPWNKLFVHAEDLDPFFQVYYYYSCSFTTGSHICRHTSLYDLSFKRALFSVERALDSLKRALYSQNRAL